MVLFGHQPVSGESGGGAAGAAHVLRLPEVAGDASTGTTFDPGFSPSGVRYCRFLPGVSTGAVLGPAPAPAAPPAGVAPPNTAVAAEVTEDQLAVFTALWNVVDQKCADPAFNGADLDALRAEYEQKIIAGLSPEGFGALMKLFIAELDDDHSQYQTPLEVQEEEDRLTRPSGRLWASRT